MGYQPIHDGKFDVACESVDDLTALLASVFERKLVIVGYNTDGDSGSPEFTLRGTRRQLVSWLNDYYDPDQNAIGGPGLDDDAVWHAHNDMGAFTFIA